MAAFDTTAFETLAGLVIVLEPTEAIVYWNRATSELVGCSLDEVRGQPLRKHLAPAADPAVFEAAIEHAVTTRLPGRFETTASPRAGVLRTIAFSTSVAEAAEGGVQFIVLNGIDITDAVADRGVGDRMPTQEALRLSEERLRVSLQASPAVVFNQDLQLRYTWIHNPKQPFIAEQVLGKTDFDLLPHADAEQLAIPKRHVIETVVGARTIVRTTIGGDAF